MKGLVISTVLAVVLSSCVVATKPGVTVISTPNKVIVHPRVVFIPDYDIYIVDDDRYEVYKYKNRWYWYYGGVWYFADDYNGPWLVLKGPLPFKIPPGHIKQMYRGKKFKD